MLLSAFADVAHAQDTDGDGFTDAEEIAYCTNPLDFDTDDDGLGDGGEEVRLYGTDPLEFDTDDDGLPDGFEVFIVGTSPTNRDSDGDAATDGEELFITGTDPLVQDTSATFDGDGDGLFGAADNAPSTFNPDQEDLDADGIGDAADGDIDGDGIPNSCDSSPTGNLVPTANAGPDQSVDEGAPVTLDGSASFDPDGEPLTYSWVQVAGPFVALSGVTTAFPSFVAPLVPLGGATLSFRLTVHDGITFGVPDAVDITVKNINHAPVAFAGDDQTVATGSLVTLNGAASFDPDGDPLAYAWLQTGGPLVTLAGANGPLPSFTAPLVGGATLTFQLTVSDSLASASDLVDIRVESANHAPIADAGDPQTVAEGALVVLDATASADPDGDPLGYSWSQLAGPVVVLSNGLTATPSFVAPLVGLGGATLVFRVTVIDGALATATDDVVISVLDANAPPMCGLARPSVAEIWPPNHKLVEISILGVTDPELGAVSIAILSVTQDEPISGLGDGDTEPDAVIQGESVLLRAERSGTGNGRVYGITFRATDAAGGSCTSTVTVTVPHSKSRNAPPPVDDGQIYNSTGA